jgi:hypothetical protein
MIIALVAALVVTFISFMFVGNKNIKVSGIAAPIFIIGLFVSVIIFLISMLISIPDGEPIKIESTIMRTNNITCITFVDVEKKLNAIISTEAWAYNAGDKDIQVMAQKYKNAWGMSRLTEYTAEK